jgi:Xaa-Pro aminopeptidase
MSASRDEARGAEVAARLALLRGALEQSGAGALRLRGSDWFAWATAGGSNSVSPGVDCGVAELLVTRDEACVLTDAVEAVRLRDEELPPGFTFHAAPWAEPELREHYVLAAGAGRALLSDRPQGDELPLPSSLRLRRLVLDPAEQERYRALGLAAAQALSAVLRRARADWTEWQLAGAGAEALLARGIEPVRVLAAGERRLGLYRRPAPTTSPLGRRAMLAFCARRHGLHANLARMVAFGPAPVEQGELMTVEATGLAAIKPGNSLSAVYHALAQGYRHAGRDDEIDAQQQGGITGYQACEIAATPSSATALEPGMALTLNPGFAGLALQDTFLLGPDGLENLTLDPEWPASNVQGRMRPLWLEATW